MAYKNISEMRKDVIAVYPGPRWQSKVNAMPDYRVIAIYHSFEERGILGGSSLSNRKSEPDFHQMTLWDYGIKKVF